jgi:DNA-binding CsgD family transcriptional regulator
MARSLLDEARGDTAGALVTLGTAWDRDASRGLIGRGRALGLELTRLALAVGDRERAGQVAAGLEAAATLAPVPSLQGTALHCRGLADDDVDVLLRSVEALTLGPRVLEHASACEDAATTLARAGRRSEATALFDEALDVYDRVGAHRDAARGLAATRELGISRKRRGARKRPASGWESLTPAELDVVRLAADGLTNPEIGQRLFVSPRTVQTHLAHVFRKLDLASRVELAAEVARRTAAPPR